MAIITISGPSGSGKTTLANYLLSLGPEYCMLESTTPRPPRPRDIPGEFLHLPEEEFKKRDLQGDFLWPVVDVHGVRYGTLKKSVGMALRESTISIMVITVDYTKRLHDFATYAARFITNLYILSPGKDVLRKRLTERGDSMEEIERRLTECELWD
jgi:guanylate kinase